MSKDNVAAAVAYYTAMGEKNFLVMEQYLHPDVRFRSPLAEVNGREAVLEAAKKFVSLVKTLTIRAKFGAGDQAIVILDTDCAAPIGKFPTASLLTFQEGLIAKIELILDARPFEKK